MNSSDCVLSFSSYREYALLHYLLEICVKFILILVYMS